MILSKPHFIASLAILLASTASATPTYSFPLSQQYPPIIQAGKLFSYQLPSDTFTSTESNVDYTTNNMPSWLSFDSSTRTFTGNSPSTEVSQPKDVQFELIGTDSAGSSSVNASFIITSQSLASIANESAIATSLQKSGNLASSNSLIITPEEPFSISFDADIFNATDDLPIVQFVPLTTSHTPLPIWISFDESTLTFSGTAPTVDSEVAPSTVYPVSLQVVQISGYSSTALDFYLKVGAHQLSTDLTSINYTVSSNEDFSTTIPLSQISLDNKTVTENDILSVNVESDWLQANSTKLSGTVPEKFTNDTLVLTITDNYGDSVEISLEFSTNDTENSSFPLFLKSSLANVNATVDTFFTYKIPTSALNSSTQSDSNVTATFSPKTDWISYHNTNFTLNGHVPKDFNETKVTLTDNSSKNSDKLVFNIKAVEKIVSSSTSSTPSATAISAPTTSQTDAGNFQDKSKKSNKKIVAIVCGVVIPIVFILVLIMLFCCWKRRKNKNIGPISGPVLHERESSVNMIQSSNLTPPFAVGSYSESSEKLNVQDSNTPVTNTHMIFDSPGDANKYNMYKLDHPKEAFPNFMAFPDSPDSDVTHIGDSPKIETARRNIMAELDKTEGNKNDSSLPEHDALIIDRPQNSWRQKTREQNNSLATLDIDEVPTMKVVNQRSSNLTREVSSPILRPLSGVISEGSGSSHYSKDGNHSAKSASIGSYSSSDSDSLRHDFGPAVPYSSTPRNTGSFVEFPDPSVHALKAKIKHTEDPSGTSEEDFNEEYKTASSGAEFNDAESSDDDSAIEPYVNSRGEWEWNASASGGPIIYGQAVDRDSSYTLEGDIRTITDVPPSVPLPQPRTESLASDDKTTTRKRKSSTSLAWYLTQDVPSPSDVNKAGPSNDSPSS